jgi:regulator of sirC expression with transglutaminase-like and TPR domain
VEEAGDMSGREHIRADFERMVKRSEDSFDLVRAAMLVAAEADPAVDVDTEMATLAKWGDELASRIEPEWNNLQRLARLRRYLYEDLGFHGDQKDYFSPENSLLPSVMRRRMGIPLTLSIIFLSLGWRIGMPLEGVGFPGHFLVRLTGEERELLLDTFHKGMSVDHADCAQMLEQITKGQVPFDAAMLAPMTKRDMIARLLMNLKGAYLRQQQDEQALLAVERLLLIHPEDADQVRDRGLLLYRLRRYQQALDGLRAYLAARPDANDRETVEHHLVSLREILASMN